MRRELCHRLPDLVQHIILEFLDWRLRCGKHIRRLPSDLPVYSLLEERPPVEIHYYEKNHPHVVGEYYDDEGWLHYYDEDGNDSYFRISLITQMIKRKYYITEEIEISYSFTDRGKYCLEKHDYEEDYDGSKHWVG